MTIVASHRYAGLVTAVVIARVAAWFFVVVSVVGFLWFLGSHDGAAVAYFVATLVSLSVFATYPRRTLTSSYFRVFLLTAAASALVTTLPQMYWDIKLASGADYPAFGLRTMECAIFVVMALEVLAWPRIKVVV